MLYTYVMFLFHNFISHSIVHKSVHNYEYMNLHQVIAYWFIWDISLIIYVAVSLLKIKSQPTVKSWNIQMTCDDAVSVIGDIFWDGICSLNENCHVNGNQGFPTQQSIYVTQQGEG